MPSGVRQRAAQQASEREQEPDRERSRSPLRAPARPRHEGPRQRAAQSSASSHENPRDLEESASATTVLDEDAKSFRLHISNLYLRNKMSAEDTKRLVIKANKAGAQGVSNLARPSLPKNAQRGLMREMIKGATLPEPYYADIPCAASPGSKLSSTVRLPFILLHEMMAMLMQTVQVGAVCTFQDVGMESKRKRFAESNAIDFNTLVPIGFHGDGVPHQKNRTVEVFSWNFAAQPFWERFLFTCIEKWYLCNCGCNGAHTINAIMRIFVWSLEVLLVGCWPTARHDNTPWDPNTDKHRRNRNGQFKFRGVLMQIRGDWAWYKQMFGFKGWASESICWRCLANKSSMPYADFSLSAKWRKTRMTQALFMARLRKEAAFINPLMGAPGFNFQYITIDVLHCMDLGVTADAIGNLFWMLLGTVYKGGNKKTQVEALFVNLKAFYRRSNAHCRLQKLTQEMIKGEKKGPKIRAKGGECRCLVPFAAQQAEELYLSDPNENPLFFTVYKAFNCLMDIYMCMSHIPFDANIYGQLCRQFLLLYKAIGANFKDPFWKIKPKFHLMQELGEFMSAELGSPEHFWAYKDESYVGFIAQIASSRGGQNNAGTTPNRLIQRVRALTVE
jgi:hypothetical protein